MGRKLEPYEVDDEGSPSTQPAVARRLIEAGINIAVGPGGSSQGLASLAVTTPNKVLSTAYALSCAPLTVPTPATMPSAGLTRR